MYVQRDLAAQDRKKKFRWNSHSKKKGKKPGDSLERGKRGQSTGVQSGQKKLQEEYLQKEKVEKKPLRGGEGASVRRRNSSESRRLHH